MFFNIEKSLISRGRWHNKNIKNKHFKVGDWELLFDSKFKNFKRKLNTHWLGPDKVEEVFENGSF